MSMTLRQGFGKGDASPVDNAGWGEISPYLALKIISQATLDQPGAKPALGRRNHRRAAELLPMQV
jgi:hypothetical protein